MPRVVASEGRADVKEPIDERHARLGCRLLRAAVVGREVRQKGASVRGHVERERERVARAVDGIEVEGVVGDERDECGRRVEAIVAAQHGALPNGGRARVITVADGATDGRTRRAERRGRLADGDKRDDKGRVIDPLA